MDEVVELFFPLLPTFVRANFFELVIGQLVQDLIKVSLVDSQVLSVDEFQSDDQLEGMEGDHAPEVREPLLLSEDFDTLLEAIQSSSNKLFTDEATQLLLLHWVE